MEQEKETGLTVEEICQMMKTFDQSSLQSFLYQREGEKLKMSRRPCDAAERSGGAGQGTSFTAEMGQKEKARIPETAVQTEGASPSASAGEEKKMPPKEDARLTVVRSPLAGVFYRAPKPGEAPYVQKGQMVKKGETLGLMEAMKLINEIPSPCEGVVREIAAEDGSFAEFNAVLMTIEECGKDV